MSLLPAVPLRGASPAAIQLHYDEPVAFYRLWLDPTLTYSAALFEPGDDLEAAQIRKLDHHAVASGAPGAARVLDVGCGWGALMRRLVTTHGVRSCTGLTLSRLQADAIRAEGDARVEVRLESFLDHPADARYDAIVSVGAFEHFCRPSMLPKERLDAYRAFFRRCAGWLEPGGRLSLQTIAVGDAPPDREAIRDGRFISEQVFPESVLPRPVDVLLASERILEIVSVRNDREHYARTCRAWRDNLAARREEAERITSAATVERFLRYLDAAARMHERAQTNLLRFVFRALPARRRA